MEQFFIYLQKSPMNMMLFGLALASGAMLIWPLITRAYRPGNEVGALEAVQLINRRDAVVVDLRDTGEYAAGHVSSAKHIPRAQLTERIKELEKFKTRPIIVSCASGSRATAAAAELRKHGFTEAVALRGGISAWQQAGLPLEK